MPATPTNDLLVETPCYTCLGIGLADSLKLALLGRIVQADSASFRITDDDEIRITDGDDPRILET